MSARASSRASAARQFADGQSDCRGRRNNDGVLDLLAVQADGAILRISDKQISDQDDGQSWETAEIARVPNAAQSLAGDVRLR